MRNGRVIAEIEKVTDEELMHSELEELVSALVKEHRLEPIKLLADKIVTEPGEAKIDVRNDPFRMIRDRSRPHYLQGKAITFILPFSGDPAILQCHPINRPQNVPRGMVAGNEIRVAFEGLEIDPKWRAGFDENLRIIQQFIKCGEPEVGGYNTALEPTVRSRLSQRKAKLIKDRSTAEAFGFPIRERTNAPQFYSVPVQRKKIPIIEPSPPGVSKPIDPFMDMAAYESVLQTIGSMARVLELNPKAFAQMDEEALRYMLLVPLNIHYEGQATGETFNWQGKTDIIIKVGGRNIFIAECLVWDGPEYFTSKIDQLLGYTSWRDTKTAIIVFNRNKNLSAVLAQIPDLAKKHSNFIRGIASYKNETGFRFALCHRDDKNRELTLTVLVFDVPKKDSP